MSHLLSQVRLISLSRVHESPGNKEEASSSHSGLQPLPAWVGKLSPKLTGELEKSQPFMQLAGMSLLQTFFLPVFLLG